MRRFVVHMLEWERFFSTEVVFILTSLASLTNIKEKNIKNKDKATCITGLM